MSFSYRIDQLTGGMVRNLAMTQRQQQKTTAALSSGFKINSAGDDAAGLQISQNLEAQIRGEKKAQENIQTMLNLLNATESLVSNVRDQFSRIRELFLTYQNGTNGTEQRQAIEREIDVAIDTAISMARDFSFNGKNYFADRIFGHGGAPYSSKFTAQIGANGDSLSQIQFDLLKTLPTWVSGSSGDLFNLELDWAGTGIRGSGLVTSALFNAVGYAPVLLGVIGSDPPNATGNILKFLNLNFLGTINTFDRMLDFFNNDVLGNIGAYTNRLEAAARNSEVKVENQMAAQARITNTDYATASVEAVRQTILQQSTISLMNQAKISHRQVINLIQQSGQV